MQRLLAIVTLVIGCADTTSAPPSWSAVPSRERGTGDLVLSASATDDGTLTRVEVALRDRLGEAKSVELVDGDHLVLVAGELAVELAQAPRVHDWETMIHYSGEVARTNLGSVAVSLRRSDGSIAHSTIVIPDAFAITSAPATVRAGDLVEIGIDPPPDEEAWGLTIVQCDDVESRASGTFYIDGDGTPGQAGIATTEMPASAASCEANLTISIGSLAGAYDAAFGNADNDTPRGGQQRTTRVRYYP